MKTSTPTIPKPEYPRPDRDRSARWLSLNGTWRLETGDATEDVLVPYAWETAASGVGRTWLEAATYRRDVTVPASWRGDRVFLCFGAVHHHARVTLDGTTLGSHTGGYTSFEYDVTDVLEPGRATELAVHVHAPADKRFIPHGKQRSLPRDDYDGVCFTPSSGIWQTVWLEARGRTYADHVQVRGDSLTGFDVTVQVSGERPAGAAVDVLLEGHGSTLRLVTGVDGVAVGRVPVDDPRLWTPEDPQLYRLTVRTSAAPAAGSTMEGAAPREQGLDADADEVVLTAGLRSVETRDGRLYLNGRRLYLRGVLDQGYWPGTGITAPDDTALVRDLQLAKECGYNLVRKHLKLEEPRFLHWADTVGMLVWAEPASTSRYSAAGAAAFEAQIRPMVERDGNHPCIVVWGLYNEEWGLDWDIPGRPELAAAARRAYDLLSTLDHTRPVVENSGWAHVRSDLLDWHYYDENPGAWARNVADIAAGRRQAFPVRLGPDVVVEKALTARPPGDTRPSAPGTTGADDWDPTAVPNVNSEYGGGFTSLERAWHLRWQTQEIRRHDSISGYVYTELTDVEHENAGIYTTHRLPKDGAGLRPHDVNAPTVIVLDVVPCQAGTDLPTPGEPWPLALRVSHHGSQPLDGTVKASWTLLGRRLDRIERCDAETPVKAEPFVVSEAVVLELPPPPVARARLHLWVDDVDGVEVARTFLDVGPLEQLPQPVNVPLEDLATEDPRT